jgi:hypothetical protein
MGKLGHSVYCCFVHKTLLWRVLGLIYLGMQMSHFMFHMSESGFFKIGYYLILMFI